MRKLSIVLALSLMLSGCSTKVEVPKDSVILREAKTSTEHFIEYSDGETTFIKNVNSKSVSELSKSSSTLRPILELPKGDARAKYEYLLDTNVVNPETIGVSISNTLPFTFNSTLKNSAHYIATMQYDGWDIVATYSTPEYIDHYMRKEATTSRVIVFNTYLKVFPKIEGNIPDPWTYINDRKGR